MVPIYGVLDGKMGRHRAVVVETVSTTPLQILGLSETIRIVS